MARPKSPTQRKVSPGNPCPFLRALVAQGQLKDDVEPLAQVARTVSRVAATGEGQPRLPALAVHGIAAIAHGLLPWQVAHTQLKGLRLNGLRDGPLDKHGVGSGILDARGQVDLGELARLDDFAADKLDAQGRKERGLGAAELKCLMDANFERARGHRRIIDRKLMDGEWPVLLKVMGKPGKRGRYLAIDELHQLFIERRLPPRMLDRLQPAAA